MGLYAKLATIQQELNVPKNQYNDYGNFNYRSCEDILEGLKPLLKKVDAAIRISDEIVQIGERYYVKATATLVDLEDESKISNTAYAREDLAKKGMDGSQITGSASSYARKYALNGLFCIDDVKDSDTSDNQEDEQQKAEEQQKQIAVQKIPDVKVKALISRCESDGVDTKNILKLYKVNSLADLTEKQFKNINDYWQKIKEYR